MAALRTEDPPVSIVGRDVLPAQPVGSSKQLLVGYAALSIALLVGYFALAGGIVVLLAFLTVQALTTSGGGFLGSKLAILTFVVGLAFARALSTVERPREDEDPGLPASRAEQPELWALVDEVSQELDLPAPDHIRLVENACAWVRQDTRLLGLVAGSRRLTLGLGLLQVLSVDELRSVLAHEMGHFARGETRVDPLVYRAGATIERTAAQLGPRSLLGRVFARYAELYQRISLAVRRRQELHADAASVRVAGRAVHESALREVHAAAAAWMFFCDRYAVPVWRAGMAPEDLYVGYRALLRDPSRVEQIAAVRADDGEPAGRFDSHPTLLARLAHARRLVDRPPPGDARSARALLLQPVSVELRVTEDVNRRALRQLPVQRYSFAGELDPAPYVVGFDADAARLSRATSDVDGLGQPAGLGRTLALIEQDQDQSLRTALTGDRRQVAQADRAQHVRHLVLGPIALSAACALVSAGRARWSSGWAEAVHLVDGEGHRLDLVRHLEEVLDGAGAGGLRAALLDAGVPLGDGARDDVVPADDEDDEDDVLAVWPGLAARRARFDGYVTRDLLVLVRQPRTWRDDWRRALGEVYGLGRSGLRAAAAERIRAVLEAPLREVCRRPDVHVVRWDDLPSVRFRAGLDKAWVLRLGGQTRPFHKLMAMDDKLTPDAKQTAALLRQLVGDRLSTRQ